MNLVQHLKMREIGAVLPRLPDSVTATENFLYLLLHRSETAKAARIANAETAAHIGNDSAAIRETSYFSRAQGS
jgi:hypothetical protein